MSQSRRLGSLDVDCPRCEADEGVWCSEHLQAPGPSYNHTARAVYADRCNHERDLERRAVELDERKARRLRARALAGGPCRP